MTAHKMTDNSWWETVTVCGKILKKEDLTDEYASTVWRNVTCDQCKDSPFFRAWSKKNQR
jgi:hypothetical protein